MPPIWLRWIIEFLKGKKLSLQFPGKPLHEHFHRKMADQPIEVIVLGFGEEMATIKPEVWITAYPLPFEEQMLVLEAEYWSVRFRISLKMFEKAKAEVKYYL